MDKSISFLLGAGFSAPKGYPVGNSLSNLLLNCRDDFFGFSTDGRLCISRDGKKPDFGFKTSYDFEFDFCCDLIQYFNELKGYFDYEEFYDFFNQEAKVNTGVKELFNTKSYGDQKDFDQMIFSLKNIYTQLVSHYLVDGDGESWYDNEGHMGGSWWPGYTGILNYFKTLQKEYLINIHTLNHDLLFERLTISDWFKDDLTDGFEELGSPYYGDILINNRNYRCRLQHYTGKYASNIRLYKLHGSKNYGVYYRPQGSSLIPETYLKTRWGIGFTELLKEVNDGNGNLKYENCWVNYHADFLTGTTSKIERYQEPLLYKTLFEHMKNNLEEAERLVIIGYGGRDSEVNRMLLSHFDFRKKPSYIIDPYPGKNIKELKDQLGARLITKHLEDVSLDDFL
ncbi:hypothetical protein JAO76_01405 [Pontibacter sp. BT310]|uniref:SIR2-like domain-containing protein n=1 Tax=Pontibacter populi TaxID=890055 RepID=A0ABS6X9B7_9BACT|nr:MULTISPECIES: hypothetical protein [Pontibacter]MBJ6116828.1 hypothetical protein [Pontibacter sp. BT310]MBR0569250.1 hypothetical protein [Microvirga sp. STS03]MBW3363681.1 hypothetical protein [Pontibacter populi]